MSKTRAVPGVSGPAILSRTPRRVSTASALDTFARPTYCRALIPPSNPFEHSSNIQRMTLSWRSLRASPADGPEFGTVEGDGNTRLPGFVPAETAGTGKEIDAVRGAPKSVIEPEESSAFLIYFKPQGVGLRQVPLRIFRNDPNHNPFVVYLQGTGLVPEPEIALENGSSADLTSGVSTEQFGDVALGSSRDLSFTIHNPDSAGLSVSDISLWGGTPQTSRLYPEVRARSAAADPQASASGFLPSPREPARRRSGSPTTMGMKIPSRWF